MKFNRNKNNKFFCLQDKYKPIIYNLVTSNENIDYVVSTCRWFWINFNIKHNINEI